MARTSGAVSRTHLVYTELRGEILRGEIPAGAPLRLAELSARFGVSMSVVREALTRLHERHLVTLEPNVGFRVQTISEEDLHDLVDMRVQFEGLALRRSIARGGLDWEAAVVSVHHVLEHTTFQRADGLGTTDEWTAAHADFHDTLGAACESPRLLAFTRMLRDSAELYRQMSGTLRPSRDVAGEHRELMRLATTRQADAAVAALTTHFTRTAHDALGEAFDVQSE